MFEAFAIGPFVIWTRLVFLLLGIWLSAEFFIRLARSANLSLQNFRDNAVKYLIAFLAGARIVAMIAEYRVYLKDPLRVFIFWDGGFSFLGGAVGIAFVLYWITQHQRATFLQWLDVLLPVTSFGLAFDWFGKFFAGRSYGAPADFFWGVTYDTISVRYAVPVHPVQLYYAFFYLVLTFILLIVRKYTRRAGAETLVGIMLAGAATFFMEYFRGDFAIPVFATQIDFIVLSALFASLGVFAAVEFKLSRTGLIAYEICLVAVFGGYLILRSVLTLPTYELRFSQFLAILSALAALVYVLVHRRRYPNL